MGLDAAVREAPDEIQIAVQKVEARKILGQFPPDFIESDCLWLSVTTIHLEKKQQEGAAPSGHMLIARQFSPDLAFHSEFLTQLSDEGLFGRFTRLHFATGKLPLQPMAVAGKPLSNQKLAITAQNPGDNN